MQIKCSSCGKAINIPDDKLPKGQAFSISCPACKTKNKVDQHLQGNGSGTKAPAAKEQTLDTTSIVVSDDFDEEDELKIYEEGDKVALILDKRHEELWIKNLKEKKYHIETARSPEHAVHKMKFNEYDLVALDENYGNVPLKENAAFKSLQEMAMSSRRKIFVALTGKNFKTLNNMQAYQWSVNLVINEKDINRLPKILKKALGENDYFYKIYRETLHALGKI